MKLGYPMSFKTLATVFLISFSGMVPSLLNADESRVWGTTTQAQLSDEVAREPGDGVLLGMSGTELAVAGSVASTAAIAGYGLYTVAKGGESVAAVVAALIALEVASLVVLGGFVVKAGIAGYFLLPWNDDSELELPGEEEIKGQGSTVKSILASL